MTLIDRINTPGCGCDDAVTHLMTVSDAVEAGLALADPIEEIETVPLQQARGRILAAPILARADMPRFDNSGMDGYALCLDELPQTQVLPVQGESAAGAPTPTLERGTMMRIFTGAPAPIGADTVVMQEHVSRDGKFARITKIPAKGSNIRRAGEDQKTGDVLLDAGAVLEPKHIAICAGAGQGHIPVLRKLRVGVILTGDELCAAGDGLTDGAIWDVNTPMLLALLDDIHADIVAVEHVPDTKSRLLTATVEMSWKVDVIITSGGVSVGDRDHVKPMLQSLGAHVAVSGVAIKPGKPITVSKLANSVVISLPGNPVSAFVTWQVLGRPIAAKIAGQTQNMQPRRHVHARGGVQHKTGRCEYRPASIVGYDPRGLEVVACPPQTRSANLSPLTNADGLILIPGNIEHVPEGDLLEFLPF